MVRAACDAQILLPGPVLDEQAADSPAAARELLRDHAPVAAAELAEVSSSLGRLPTATVPERVALLNRLESAQQRLNALGSQPGRLRVNEDYVLDPFEVSAAGYRQALDDLAGAAEFAALFDRHHELRALACTLFVDRFGPGAAVPLVDHAAGLVDGVLSREARIDDPAQDFGPRDGSLAQLLKLRASTGACAAPWDCWSWAPTCAPCTSPRTCWASGPGCGRTAWSPPRPAVSWRAAVPVPGPRPWS